MPANESAAVVLRIERPSRQLLTYYALKCLLTGPLYPFVFLPHYFKYHTLRYRFDEEGISMRWGILFRREVILNYARIQDIHLSSNLVERWLGLSKIQIQTASGSSDPEMTIEGLHEYEAVRDFLYIKMRGFKDASHQPDHPSTGAVPASDADSELAKTLEAIADELRAIRTALQENRSQSS